MGSLFDLPFDDEPDAGQPAASQQNAPREPAPGAPDPGSEMSDAGASSVVVSDAGLSHAVVRGAAVPDAPIRRRVLTVTELTAGIRGLLEDRFADVWVEGEVSNCRVWNTGHMYFTLKDRDAQLKGVMFRSALRLLKFKPQDGLRVVARGRVSVYDPKGEYQIVCEHLEPEGLGALQLAFDQLKQRLAAEGLFAQTRKRDLPTLPRRIGIVTSPDGAALRDIVHVLRRRYPQAHLVIAPTRVQGEGAAIEIARALGAIGRVDGVDVVIVGRGGGSIEDLWAFNEEVVARAIAGCPVPTVSAVGHETDVTIADFVADVRAPTPSAAAEIVVARKDEFTGRIERLSHRVLAAVRGRLHRAESRLRLLEASRGLAGFHGHVALRGRHVAELEHELHRCMATRLGGLTRDLQAARASLDRFDLRHRLADVRARLATLESRLGRATTGAQHTARRRFHEAAARLEALSPLSVLGRGYAVCWNEDRTAVLRDATTVSLGHQVHVRLARGTINCTVTGRNE